jgi:hypothetical protein
VGVVIEGRFEKIEEIKTRDLYQILLKKRVKGRKNEEMKRNKTMTEDGVRNELTTNEKKYWFKCAHKTIQTNNRKAHWLRNENGQSHKQECPVCKTDKETWEHYEYDCRMVQQYIERIEDVYKYYMEKTGKSKTWAKPTREEWRLDMDTDMDREKMVLIAKARYVYEKTRWRLDYRQRRAMKLDHLIDELTEKLEPTIKREMTRQKGEEERRKKKKTEPTDERNKKRKGGGYNRGGADGEEQAAGKKEEEQKRERHPLE